MSNSIPLSIYIHFPWCVRKCPYCDFLSYAITNHYNYYDHYIDALIQDLQQDLAATATDDRKQKIVSIYIGGGTPSLLPPDAIAKLLEHIHRLCKINRHTEITIEANPDTIDYNYCKQLRDIGINRLSIGAQSFQDDKLKIIGRIHNAISTQRAIIAARDAGFNNINLDLMFGLPTQTIDDALYDLKTAIALAPTHISWYQFTLEVGSLFYRNPPPNIPNDEYLWQMQQQGKKILSANGFKQYEISAYSKRGYQCQHNLNYWQFGDYLGIGAGAHGKLTLKQNTLKKNSHALTIIRYNKISNPHIYCSNTTNSHNSNNDEYSKQSPGHCYNLINPKISAKKAIASHELPFEFMLNALRLHRPIAASLFTKRTGLPLTTIDDKLKQAEKLGLIKLKPSNKHIITITTTTKGKNFLNDLLEIFMV